MRGLARNRTQELWGISSMEQEEKEALVARETGRLQKAFDVTPPPPHLRVLVGTVQQ